MAGGTVVAVVILRGALPAWAKGSGDGDSYGHGYGYGYGYGDGYGDGHGYGYGDGYGHGYGDGSGSGYGSGSYWLATVQYFASKWSDAQRARLDALRKSGAKIAFWRSNADGTPANGGKCAAVKVGDVHKETGPLQDECGCGQLHATLIPPKWKGERWWVVALVGEVRGDDEKYWALEREIIGEAL